MVVLLLLSDQKYWYDDDHESDEDNCDTGRSSEFPFGVCIVTLQHN